MPQSKIRQILAGLILVTILIAVPGAAEAKGFVPRGGTSVWSVAAHWLAQQWNKVRETLTLDQPPQEERILSLDKKGSSLDPNG